MFQSTPPHGGATPRLHVYPHTWWQVSIHAPAWGGRLSLLSRSSSGMWFQSTPPHGGRPLGVCSRFPDYWFQSTPPHGGRLLYRVEILGCSVSIHAPAWGATPRGRNRRSRSHCFNPRPRMGGDLARLVLLLGGSRVSIHAPAWGATAVAGVSSMEGRFQSTPPHGGRPFFVSFFSLLVVSIHAPAWGATMICRYYSINRHVSIHAPAWGGTPS